MTTSDKVYDLEDLKLAAQEVFLAKLELLSIFIDLAEWQKKIILEKGIDKSDY